jgi:glutamine synthetase
VYTDNPRTKRIEYRPPDNSCNGYLALAAMLMAGLDGIQNKIDPGEPLDKESYHLSPTEATAIKTVSSSLEEALDALEKNHDYLLKGDVFTKDAIEVWLEYRRSKEVDAIRLRPHPYEFYLYFDI